ncbi:MAG: FAD-binding protein [Methylotenera sp.]|nr:FAD-binding protein [Oligoflexia bacterium]
MRPSKKKTLAPGWDFDCAVIGGGPGGLVSALSLKRFRRKVILLNSGKPRAAWIPKAHNLMGFPGGISGKFEVCADLWMGSSSLPRRSALR